MALGWRRVAAAGLLTVMVAALFAAPSHAQAPSGVGSAGGSTTLAALDAGDLLKLALIGEQNSASIDPADGTPTASEAVTPLTVVSKTLPALDALTTPAVSTNSTGAPDTKQTAQIDLGSVPQPAPLLSGTVNAASLSSLVDSSGAHSTMNATLANVAVAAGVAKIDSASVDIGSIASSTQSTSSRTVTVNGVTVLDLRALLQMVGLDLNKLPLQTLADLIQQLGLLDTLNAATGQNFGSAADIVNALTTPAITNAQNAVNTAQAAVNTAQTTFDSAQSALATAQTTLDGANAQLATANQTLASATAAASGLLCGTIDILNPLCVALASAQAAVTTATSNVTVAQTAFNTAQTAFNTAKAALDAAVAALNAALAALNAVLGQLQGVIDGLANTLELQPLLRVEGIEVGASSLAADTVGNSSAVTTATIGNIKVGGINLGGIDAGATLDQITALAGQATQAVDNVLSSISPQLANLVHVELFKHSTDVAQNGDYVNALAGITGLLATITPPDVCALLNDVLTQLPVGLNSLPGVTLPALPISGVLSTIGSTINCSVPGILQAQATIPALTTPITLAAAQANSAAAFAPAQQSTTTTTTTTTTPSSSTTTPSSSGTPTTTNTSEPLARTGAENALFLFAGALLLAVAYATRRTMVAVKAQNHSQ